MRSTLTPPGCVVLFMTSLEPLLVKHNTFNFQGPLSVIGGIVLGVLCGYLVKFVPERNDAFLVPLRVLLLLAGGLMMVLGSEEVGWGGAGKLTFLKCFILSKRWLAMSILCISIVENL